MEHGASGPADANIACFDNLERHDRGVHQVPQFMSEEPAALGPACRCASRIRTLKRMDQTDARILSGALAEMVGTTRLNFFMNTFKKRGPTR